MGYTTDFDGYFTVTPRLDEDQVAYLKKFSETRRMKRDAAKTALRPDPLREAVGLPVGPEGGYFVGAEADFGQEFGADDVTNSNYAPRDQPSLWCQWVPTDDGGTIEWNGAEKFYNYIEWLQYFVDHFFKPWGRVLNGSVRWAGEELGDCGVIFAKDNQIAAVEVEEPKSPFDESEAPPLQAAAPTEAKVGEHRANCPAAGSITGGCNCGSGQ